MASLGVLSKAVFVTFVVIALGSITAEGQDQGHKGAAYGGGGGGGKGKGVMRSGDGGPSGDKPKGPVGPAVPAGKVPGPAAAPGPKPIELKVAVNSKPGPGLARPARRVKTHPRHRDRAPYQSDEE